MTCSWLAAERWRQHLEAAEWQRPAYLVLAAGRRQLRLVQVAERVAPLLLLAPVQPAYLEVVAALLRLASAQKAVVVEQQRLALEEVEEEDLAPCRRQSW